jgi:hypothetical protein
MAKGKKKSKKDGVDAVAPAETTTAQTSQAQKLDVSKVEVAQAQVPPSRRLFPTSLIAELDSIKARLDELEKKLK